MKDLLECAAQHWIFSCVAMFWFYSTLECAGNREVLAIQELRKQARP